MCSVIVDVADNPESEQPSSPVVDCRARVEDVEDDDNVWYIECYPEDRKAGVSKGWGVHSSFELCEEQLKLNERLP